MQALTQQPVKNRGKREGGERRTTNIPAFQRRDRFQKFRQINFLLVPSKTVEWVTKQALWQQLSEGTWALEAGLEAPGGGHAKARQPIFGRAPHRQIRGCCGPGTAGFQ